MEVGAVKQAFNNEVILLKKKLNQARIQIIHKLTRKAKTLTEKKVPENIKEKLKRKAESAVREILIIKKIKAKDIAKFIITHKGELKDFLNRPQVDIDKACARLLLHKSLQDKYRFIRDRFSKVSIDDLLMSRQERIQLKKDAKEKQKNKRKKKAQGDVVNTQGDWSVEDLNVSKSNDEDATSNSEKNSVNETEDEKHNGSDNEIEEHDLKMQIDFEPEDSDSETDIPKKLPKAQKTTKPILKDKQIKIKPTAKEVKPLNNKLEKKTKEGNKNKNFNEKILKRKFKKDTDDVTSEETKVVDPFFITETGESYMTVAEPRPPDEFKEIHKQGNRKLRRAVMFGHVPKVKPNQEFRSENNKFDRNNGFQIDVIGKKRFNADDKFDKSNVKSTEFNIKEKDSKSEKLHPSWEAKKKQSGMLPFQGKKTVFDDS